MTSHAWIFTRRGFTAILFCLVFTIQSVVTPTRAADFEVDHVIHITVDGLRGSVIPLLGPSDLPNFHRIQNEGAYTNNARTLRENTVTMPNHISALTGRPRDGVDGHGVTRNSDPGISIITVHTDKGSYVHSTFDVVHDNGGSTAFYAGWNGFNYINNSWDEVRGGPDLIGPDNGRDKIDTFNLRTNDDIAAQMTDVINDLSTDPYDYTFVHLHRTDSAGHGNGWDSTVYQDAVRNTDTQIGRLMNFIDSDPTLAGNTAIVLTSDHGGQGTGHGNINDLDTFRIPVYTWISGEQIGQELYSANSGVRADPGDLPPEYSAPLQPIRNGDTGNLALDLLGLGAVPGSTINSQQDLRLQFDVDDLDEFFLFVDPTTGAAQIRNQTGSAFAFDGYTITSPSNSLTPDTWQSLDDLDGPGNEDGGWRESNISSGQLAELFEDSGSFSMLDGELVQLEEILAPFNDPLDLQFEVLLPGQSEGSSMQVVYASFMQPVESINEAFLLVDPETGDIQLRNQSGEDLSLEGYTIRSNNESLNPDDWQSLDDLDGPGNDDGGWRESNASMQQLAELLEAGAEFTLADGHVLRLGDAFDAPDGVRDLLFELLLAGESEGESLRVIYDSLAEDPDFDGNGVVDALDYALWREQLGAEGIGLDADGDGNGIVDALDYEIWRANFGTVIGASSLAGGSTATPEPSSLLLGLFCLGSASFGRRGYRRCSAR